MSITEIISLTITVAACVWWGTLIIMGGLSK